MLYTTWYIIPKTILQIIYDVFIFVAKVIYSVTKYRGKIFDKTGHKVIGVKLKGLLLNLFFYAKMVIPRFHIVGKSP